MTKKLFECSCHCHGVTVETLDWDDGNEVYMVWWNRGGGGKWRLKLRLQHIWHVIKHGKPKFQNEIILTPKEARALGEYLVEVANKTTSDIFLDHFIHDNETLKV